MGRQRLRLWSPQPMFELAERIRMGSELAPDWGWAASKEAARASRAEIDGGVSAPSCSTSRLKSTGPQLLILPARAGAGGVTVLHPLDGFLEVGIGGAPVRAPGGRSPGPLTFRRAAGESRPACGSRRDCPSHSTPPRRAPCAPRRADPVPRGPDPASRAPTDSPGDAADRSGSTAIASSFAPPGGVPPQLAMQST